MSPFDELRKVLEIAANPASELADRLMQGLDAKFRNVACYVRHQLPVSALSAEDRQLAAQVRAEVLADRKEAAARSPAPVETSLA